MNVDLPAIRMRAEARRQQNYAFSIATPAEVLFLLDRIEEARTLVAEFRHDFLPFITAFEANDPWSGDGEELAARFDAWLAAVGGQPEPSTDGH